MFTVALLEGKIPGSRDPGSPCELAYPPHIFSVFDTAIDTEKRVLRSRVVSVEFMICRDFRVMITDPTLRSY